jgi:hypothetical protein
VAAFFICCVGNAMGLQTFKQDAVATANFSFDFLFNYMMMMMIKKQNVLHLS